MRGIFEACRFSLLIVVLAVSVCAQQGPPPYAAGPGPHHPGPHSPLLGPPGKWWNDPGVVQQLAISADQQKRMESLFQQNRLHLIDLTAALEKENAILDPLLQADRPDEARVLAQIDRIAQARAELEKANARFLLGLRAILTPEQWRKLESQQPPPPDGRHGPPPPHF